MTNNAAERALRGIAVGRHNWTFAGSDDGGRRAAAIYTLIETAKLNDVDPQAWLADVLARLHDHPAKRIAELLPWNWKRQPPSKKPRRRLSVQIFQPPNQPRSPLALAGPPDLSSPKTVLSRLSGFFPAAPFQAWERAMAAGAVVGPAGFEPAT